jgi:N-acetylneuraminic acid mutarotase
LFKLHITFIASLISCFGFSQNYVWKSGTTGLNPSGLYGVKGMADVKKSPKGRADAAQWMDKDGNLWLFGGRSMNIGNIDILNDLWKYEVSTNTWTWMHGDSTTGSVGFYGTMGIPNASNEPPARSGAVAWVDSSNNLWLFGGSGYPGGLNDLWKYNITSNKWTWINGSNLYYQTTVFGTIGIPSNSCMPGSRCGAVGWRDSLNNLWLFGGTGINIGYGQNNELWKYNINTNQWTWVKGSNIIGHPGSYGTQGVPAAGNVPPSRAFAATWIDNSGNFWLFGGQNPPYDSFDDLWKYNPASNVWVWTKGTSSVNVNGTYGTLGVASASNHPGGRAGTAHWKSSTGKLMLFGGWGFAATGNFYYLNDLWSYDPILNEWTWIKGSNAVNQLSSYGVQGIASPSNRPGARVGLSAWASPTSNLAWMFGGQGYLGYNAFLNDLWYFGNCTPPSLSITASSNTLCIGQTATLSAQGGYSYLWNGILSGSTVSVTPLVTSNYSVYSTNSIGCSSTGSLTIMVIPSPTLNVSTTNTVICNGTVVTVTASGASTYSWSTGFLGSTLFISPIISGGYSVTGFATNGCSSTRSMAITVDTPTISINSSSVQLCAGQTTTLYATGAPLLIWSTGWIGDTLVHSPSVSTNYSVTGMSINGCTSSAVYFKNVDLCLGTGKSNLDGKYVSVYPNPTRGIVDIDCDGLGSRIQIRITSLLGQEVYNGFISCKEKIDISDFDKGIYTVVLLEGSVISRIKIIKE